MTALFLGAHADDIELGCGATFQQYEKAIYVAFSSCGKFELIEECKRSAFLLHAHETLIFDFKVRDFDKSRQEILDRMIQLRSKYKPDFVYTHSHDTHQDHQVIHNESIRAFKHTNLLAYELPWNDRHTNLNTFVPITHDQLKTKMKAIWQYKTQAHRSYMNTNFITSLATVRGVQAGCEYAEAFESIRRF